MDKSLSLDEIHLVTLELLKKIISICEVLNINYYLAFGSLLGAVRHKGFIPWDDDFDIFFHRSDYEKFIKYCVKNKESLYPFDILDYKYNNKYPYPIARFIDTRYSAVFNNCIEYGCGAFIDIYPLDLVDSKKGINRIVFYRKLYKRIIEFSASTTYNSPKNLFTKLVKPFIYMLSKCVGSYYFCKQLDNLALRNRSVLGDSLMLIVWNNKTFITKKENFDDFEYVDFENIKVKIPVGYHDILSGLYGEYMIPPNHEDCKPHHNYNLFKKG